MTTMDPSAMDYGTDVGPDVGPIDVAPPDATADLPPLEPVTGTALEEMATDGTYDVDFLAIDQPAAYFGGPADLSDAVDTDGDNYKETRYLDQDGDGINETALSDTDGDGWNDRTAVDSDGDGNIDQLLEGRALTPGQYSDPNVQGDQQRLSVDTDGDGVLDTTLTDTNRDHKADTVTTAEGTATDTDFSGNYDTVTTDTNADGVAETTRIAPVGLDTADPNATPAGPLGPTVDRLIDPESAPIDPTVVPVAPVTPVPADPSTDPYSATPVVVAPSTDPYSAEAEREYNEDMKEVEEWQEWLATEKQERYVDSFTNPYTPDPDSTS